jgi:hypothetical protein
MLNKAKTLEGFKLHGLNGEIGTVKQFYFDDHYWTVRHLVVDTGNWLVNRQVLISPYSITEVNLEERYFAVNLTKKQIEDSPHLETDQPISRQFEVSYYGYYGWPTYWVGPYAWGYYPNIVPGRDVMGEYQRNEKSQDHHLRSTQDVTGRDIEAIDGALGHVEDFIIDDETWGIRYLVVDTRNWWPGKKVLISPQWIDRISWAESKVFINLSRETIKSAPEYFEESPLTRDYEKGLHLHYHRKGYWHQDDFAKNSIPKTILRKKEANHQRHI